MAKETPAITAKANKTVEMMLSTSTAVNLSFAESILPALTSFIMREDKTTEAIPSGRQKKILNILQTKKQVTFLLIDCKLEKL